MSADQDFVISPTDTVLITGAAGFIGRKVVKVLLDRGFTALRCFARPSADIASLKALPSSTGGRARVEFSIGNLLSMQDCLEATRDARVIYHLAAGRGEKSYPGAFLNSVVTTRNLLDACLSHGCIRRFVNVSSFAVYSNKNKPHGRVLDESCPVEENPKIRGEAYCYAKIRQEEIVAEYRNKSRLSVVTIRPGYVYGPEKPAISDRVGIDTFGLFLHLGGSNRIPFTYIDNCAEAIVLAGLTPGIDGEVFNVVDDSLPTSRRFLRMYKREVSPFFSLYIPHGASYFLSYLWEKYSGWSKGQLPPSFNRSRWNSYTRKTVYSNDKMKRLTGWQPAVSIEEGLRRYFAGCRSGRDHD